MEQDLVQTETVTGLDYKFLRRQRYQTSDIICHLKVV